MLRLLQLADSALPIGGYTHSWGLEAAIARGIVSEITGLERWVRSWLKHTAGPLEGVIAATAWGAMAVRDRDTLRKCNELLEASVIPPSLRMASREMGEQLLRLAEGWAWAGSDLGTISDGTDWRGWHHPVGFGMLANRAGADAETAVAAFLQQAAFGIISAGVRAIPVSHTHGQQLLAYLHDDIASMASQAVNTPLAEAGSSSPFYEVLCDEQTQLYCRLFRS